MANSATVDAPVRRDDLDTMATADEGSTPLTDTQLRLVTLGSLALLFFAYISRMSGVSHDIYHAMALFRESLAAGWVPFEDAYAYVPTVNPSVHHEWGFGAIMYFVVKMLGTGGTGLMAMKYALIGGTMVACYARTRRGGGTWQLFAAVAPLAFPLVWVACSTIRAQLFTLTFLAVLMLLLDVERRPRRDGKSGRLWPVLLWIPLHCIWLNVHAGFVVGLVAFGFHCMEVLWNEWSEHGFKEAFRRNYHLPVTLVVLVASTWVNPYGSLYVQYLLEGLTMDRPLIVEWRPLWFTFNPVLALSVWGISVGLTVYTIVSLGLRRAFSCLLVLLGAYMAMKHLRHGSIYAVLWLSVVPALLQATPYGRRIESWIREKPDMTYNFATKAAVVALLILIFHRFWEPKIGTSLDVSTALPSAAVEYLDESGFNGNLMTPFHAGAFVSWKLYPKVKVSMDGRYEAAYPHGALSETTAFYKATGEWRDTLDKYDTDAVLVMRDAKVEPKLAALVSSSDNAAGWQRVYIDDTFTIYAKPDVALPTVDRTGQPILASFP